MHAVTDSAVRIMSASPYVDSAVRIVSLSYACPRMLQRMAVSHIFTLASLASCAILYDFIRKKFVQCTPWFKNLKMYIIQVFDFETDHSHP